MEVASDMRFTLLFLLLLALGPRLRDAIAPSAGGR
jgi:hypothetical protein